MFTIEVAGSESEISRRPRWLAVVTGIWGKLRGRYEMRRDLMHLSRLSPRLIRDAGFDPEHIHAALDGGWDEVPRKPFHD